MQDPISHFLESIGEEAQREGLQKTPKRWADAMQFLTSGYNQSIEEIVNGALFAAETDGMVLIKDIEFYSLCEHHILPFSGKMHIAYIPDAHILGLSKIPRIVDMFARRLQVQERLGQQICDTLHQILQPKGIGVIIEAEHFCMMMRGVQKQHTTAVTSQVKGLLKTDEKTRQEFLQLAGY